VSERLIIAAGSVPTGPGGSLEVSDLAIEDGRIVEIEPELDRARAATVVDASGHVVLPGLVDTHVHVSGRFGRPAGFEMLVRGGVVAALDLAGDPVDLAATLPSQGCGLTVGVLYPLVPGETISSATPPRPEIEDVLETQLALGALGLKILGGHFPLAPESTREVIEICAGRSVYCAVHAGSTATGSDVTGVEELVELAGGHPVHVAHVNSYCRGQIEDPVAEASRALSALADSPSCWSESYLSVLNGAEARCRDGIPLSGVVRTCLRLGGFDETKAGLEAAIDEGWGRVQGQVDGRIGYLAPSPGLELFRKRQTDVGIGFPVNPPASSVALALARAPDRSFIVDAFASDGGSIPRNTILEQGMALVRAGLLSLADLVHKACRVPAERLALDRKGRIEPGADADIIVLAESGSCRDVVIAGKLVMRDRTIVRPGGGRLLRPG
jgi:hypothetical protein